MSNLIASIIFFATGIIILYLKAAGKLGMGNLEGYQNNNGRRKSCESICRRKFNLNIIFVVFSYLRAI